MGVWLSVAKSAVYGVELGVQKCRYSIFLQYGIDPPDLPHHFDFFRVGFSISHELECNKGGLVTSHQN